MSQMSPVCTHTRVLFVCQWCLYYFLIFKETNQYSWGSEQVYKTVTLKCIYDVHCLSSHLDFQLNLEFHLGPNFSNGFPDYWCGSSFLVHRPSLMGGCELWVDSCIYLTCTDGEALVFLCQKNLRVNIVQTATRFVSVKNQYVSQLAVVCLYPRSENSTTLEWAVCFPHSDSCGWCCWFEKE